ncbi:uncharacterized protein K02A2.6-like [Uranotaenia lowii]|uniref:uncharacterized protein K02A2.6-like n=1 Tax=Uranotaenia lowii TaxID=190385 RepID=UPI002478F21C|nr:uncharacterized protein K02A2.6-like [Uranotaenia lowii]
MTDMDIKNALLRLNDILANQQQQMAVLLQNNAAPQAEKKDPSINPVSLHPKPPGKKTKKMKSISLVKHVDISKKRKFAEVNLNGVNVKLQLDCAADITIISTETWACIGKPKINPTNIVAVSASGDKLDLKGEFITEVTIRNVSKQGCIYVANHSDLDVLGIDLIELFNLWSVPFDSLVNSIQKSEDVAQRLKVKFPEVFQSSLGLCTKAQVTLYLKPDSRPVYCPKRPVAYAALPKVDAELQRLQERGIISPVQFSNWAAPIVVVRKSDNVSVRICGDYSTGLNAALESDRHPLPHPDDIFTALAGARIFSQIDLSDAYLQVEVEEESRKLLTVNTHRGLFQYNRLAPGIKSAPGAFQRIIDCMVAGIPGVKTYLDDILVSGRTQEEHDRNLDATLGRIRDYGKKGIPRIQHFKKDPRKTTLESWPLPSKPMERIHIDYAGPIDGFYYLVIVDAYSKWPEVFRTRSTTTTATLDFLQETFARYGYPHTLVSDNGSQFISAQFQQFCKEHGIQHLTTAPYHPQSNGQAERFVDSLKRGLKKLANGESMATTQHLQTFLSVYRSTPARSAPDGKTPAHLFLGRQISTQLDLLKPTLPSPTRINDAQNAQFNKHHGAVQRKFVAGNPVLAKVHQGNSAKWIPGRIIEPKGNVMYTVLLDNGRLIRSHTNQLKAWFIETAAPVPTPNLPLSVLLDDFVVPVSGADQTDSLRNEDDLDCSEYGSPLQSPEVPPPRTRPTRNRCPPKRLSSYDLS